MRIVMISDTHGQHDSISVPDGDILLHAGDFSGRGTPAECAAFLEWMAALPHPHKVFIAGNHDFLAERDPEAFARLIPSSLTYLNDSGTDIAGLRIWGSPIQPWFHDWAFNRQLGPDIARHWQLIPPGTDILLVHGPAHSLLDTTTDGRSVGCPDLLARIRTVQPRLFVCGHIHEAYGRATDGPTTHVNASNLNVRYRPVHPAQVFDW